MKRILMTFTNVSWQKGSAAQVSTFVKEIRKLDTTIEFTLLSHCYDVDRKPASVLGINLTNLRIDPSEPSRRRSLRIFYHQLKLILWSLLKGHGINIPALVNNPIASAYLETDLIADFSGDSYRDRPGGVSLAHNVNVIAAKLLNKPIVLFSQSLGPFKWYSRRLSRYSLNFADLIYIREKRTLSILQELKIKSRITVAPDIAFLLTSCKKEQKLLEIFNKEGFSKEGCNKRLIGISISNLLYSLSEKKRNYDYLALMVQLIEYLHDSYHADVLLIAHEIKPACMGIDDRFVSRKLAEKLRHPSWLKVIKFDYDASEIKTIISSLHVLIAARMHAGIAALSLNIPTIFLSWSHKYIGLLEEIGIPDFVWDINTQSLDELKNLLDKLMRNRESIKQTLSRYNSLSEESIKSQLQAVLGILYGNRSTQPTVYVA
jgi:polysaccharide pyruvyl transferase WcaK-like protein